MAYELPPIDHNYERQALQAKSLKIPFWLEDLCANTNSTPTAPPKFYTPGFFAHHDPADIQLLRFRNPNDAGNFPFNLKKDFTSMKPGKFLKEFFSDKLTDPQIADLAAAFRADALPPELSFATTADEIERVYDTGPESCMRKPGVWKPGKNPVRAYAGHGLAIAYIKRRDKITARALCWPENKIHSRIYGDAITIQKLLKEAGYTNTYSSDIMNRWCGARLTPIELPEYKACDGGKVYSLPYGDSLKHVNLITPANDEPYFVIINPNKEAHIAPRHVLSGGASCSVI